MPLYRGGNRQSKSNLTTGTKLEEWNLELSLCLQIWSSPHAPFHSQGHGSDQGPSISQGCLLRQTRGCVEGMISTLCLFEALCSVTLDMGSSDSQYVPGSHGASLRAQGTSSLRWARSHVCWSPVISSWIQCPFLRLGLIFSCPGSSRARTLGKTYTPGTHLGVARTESCFLGKAVIGPGR